MLVKIGVCLEQEHIFYFDRLGITFSVYEELFQSVPAARADKAAIYPVQEVEVMPDERVLNLASLYAESFGIQRGNQLYFTVAKPAFLYCDDMFFIEGKDLTFATLTELFDLENVFFLLVINGDAGELFRGNIQVIRSLSDIESATITFLTFTLIISMKEAARCELKTGRCLRAVRCVRKKRMSPRK